MFRVKKQMTSAQSMRCQATLSLYLTRPVQTATQTKQFTPGTPTCNPLHGGLAAMLMTAKDTLTLITLPI